MKVFNEILNENYVINESTVELDWANDKLPDEISNTNSGLRKFKIKFNVINDFGPAGGASVIKFTGKRSDLEKFILYHYDGGDKIAAKDMYDLLQD